MTSQAESVAISYNKLRALQAQLWEALDESVRTDIGRIETRMESVLVNFLGDNWVAKPKFVWNGFDGSIEFAFYWKGEVSKDYKAPVFYLKEDGNLHEKSAGGSPITALRDSDFAALCIKDVANQIVSNTGMLGPIV